MKEIIELWKRSRLDDESLSNDIIAKYSSEFLELDYLYQDTLNKVIKEILKADK